MSGAPKTWIALVLTLAVLAPLAPELGRATKAGICCRAQTGVCRCPQPMGLSGVCAMKSSCGSEAPAQASPELAAKGLLPRAVVANVKLVPGAPPVELAQVLEPQAILRTPDRPPRLLELS